VRTWRHFWRLPGDERWLALQALALVPAVSAGVRWFGLRRVVAVLNGGHPGRAAISSDRIETTDNAAQLARARTTAALVSQAAGHSPIPATCLARSVVLCWLLRREGIRGELRIGVARQSPAEENAGEGRLLAHAWVELDGLAIDDTDQVRQQFAPFAADLLSTSLYGEPGLRVEKARDQGSNPGWTAG
jgi:hypothetical protein